LRKKVGPFVEVREPVPRRVRTEVDNVLDDAVSLLVVMGVKRPDALRAVEQLLSTRDEISTVQDVITEYFRMQRSGAPRRAE